MDWLLDHKSTFTHFFFWESVYNWVIVERTDGCTDGRTDRPIDRSTDRRESDHNLLLGSNTSGSTPAVFAVITKRSTGLSADQIRAAIDACEPGVLPAQSAELLLKYIPTKEEVSRSNPVSVALLAVAQNGSKKRNIHWLIFDSIWTYGIILIQSTRQGLSQNWKIFQFPVVMFCCSYCLEYPVEIVIDKMQK